MGNPADGGVRTAPKLKTTDKEMGIVRRAVTFADRDPFDPRIAARIAWLEHRDPQSEHNLVSTARVEACSYFIAPRPIPGVDNKVPSGEVLAEEGF